MSQDVIKLDKLPHIVFTFGRLRPRPNDG